MLLNIPVLSITRQQNGYLNRWRYLNTGSRIHVNAKFWDEKDAVEIMEVIIYATIELRTSNATISSHGITRIRRKTYFKILPKTANKVSCFHMIWAHFQNVQNIVHATYLRFSSVKLFILAGWYISSRCSLQTSHYFSVVH